MVNWTKKVKTLPVSTTAGLVTVTADVAVNTASLYVIASVVAKGSISGGKESVRIPHSGRCLRDPCRQHGADRARAVFRRVIAMNANFHPCNATSHWMVGRDDRDHWIICDDLGRIGVVSCRRATLTLKQAVSEGDAFTIYVTDHVIALGDQDRTPCTFTREARNRRNGWH